MPKKINKNHHKYKMINLFLINIVKKLINRENNIMKIFNPNLPMRPLQKKFFKHQILKNLNPILRKIVMEYFNRIQILCKC